MNFPDEVRLYVLFSEAKKVVHRIERSILCTTYFCRSLIDKNKFFAFGDWKKFGTNFFQSLVDIFQNVRFFSQKCSWLCATFWKKVAHRKSLCTKMVRKRHLAFRPCVRKNFDFFEIFSITSRKKSKIRQSRSSRIFSQIFAKKLKGAAALNENSRRSVLSYRVPR